MTPWSGLTEWTMIALLFASSRPPPIFSASSSDGPEEDDDDDDEGASSKNAPTPGMLFVEWRSWWSAPPRGLIDRENMVGVYDFFRRWVHPSEGVGFLRLSASSRLAQTIYNNNATKIRKMASHRERKMQPCKKQMTPFNNLHHMDRPPACTCVTVHALFRETVPQSG